MQFRSLSADHRLSLSGAGRQSAGIGAVFGGGGGRAGEHIVGLLMQNVPKSLLKTG